VQAHVTTLLAKAHQLEDDQAWGEAREIYQEALALEPANAEIHNSLGIVSEQLGAPGEAEAYFQSALQLDLGDADIYYNLGTLYQQQGRSSEAQIALEEFLSLAGHPRDIADGKRLLREVAGLSYGKCSHCGHVSVLEKLFKDTARGKACPRCYMRHQGKRRIAVLGGGAAVLLALAALLYATTPWAHYLLVNLALIWILNFLLVIPHEFCHAAATRLLGGKVFAIHLGLGPTVRETRIGKVTLSVNRYPLSGLCLAGFTAQTSLRARLFLSVAAGPAFNAVLLLLLIPAFDFEQLLQSYAFVEVLVIANAIQILTNLLPRAYNLGGVVVPSDGLQLLRILRGKLDLDDLRLGSYATETAYALHWRENERALATCDAGLAQYPGNALLGNNKAVSLFRLERYAEALSLYRELLDAQRAPQPARIQGLPEDSQPVMVAFLLNGVACTTLFNAPGPEALQEDRDDAREAFRLAPWIPSIQSTLGAVLIETGEVRIGLRHLAEASAHHEDARGAADTLAHQAIGHHRLGEHEMALSLLQQAEQLAPDLHIVRKARAELQQGHQSTGSSPA